MLYVLEMEVRETMPKNKIILIAIYAVVLTLSLTFFKKHNKKFMSIEDKIAIGKLVKAKYYTASPNESDSNYRLAYYKAKYELEINGKKYTKICTFYDTAYPNKTIEFHYRKGISDVHLANSRPESSRFVFFKILYYTLGVAIISILIYRLIMGEWIS